jgi:hypothetical protein
VDVFERRAIEKILTYEEGSDMKLTELHGGRILTFWTPLNIIGKRGARYAACIVETRHGSEMSVGIPERRDRVVGLGWAERGEY